MIKPLERSAHSTRTRVSHVTDARCVNAKQDQRDAVYIVASPPSLSRTPPPSFNTSWLLQPDKLTLPGPRAFQLLPPHRPLTSLLPLHPGLPSSASAPFSRTLLPLILLPPPPRSRASHLPPSRWGRTLRKRARITRRTRQGSSRSLLSCTLRWMSPRSGPARSATSRIPRVRLTTRASTGSTAHEYRRALIGAARKSVRR